MNKRKMLLLIIITLVIIISGIVIWKINDNNKKEYEIEEISEYKYFLLYKENKMGVINTKGEIIIEPIYDSIQIPNPSKDVFICLYDYNSQTEDYKTKVLNEKGEEVFTSYEKVTAISLEGIASDIPYEKSALIYKEQGKYGIINFEGKKLTKAIYDEIQGLIYKERELLVKVEDKYGVINTKGAVIIKPTYNSISADNYYDEETKYKYAGYIVGNKSEESYTYGYIKYDGKVLLKPEYTSITRITNIEDKDNIYLIAQDKTKVGLLKNKDIIIKFDYKELTFNEENKVLVARKNAKSGIFNLQGKEILPVKYDEIYINGQYVYTKNEEEEKCFDIDGNELQNEIYKSMSSVNYGKYYIVTDENSLYGILDENKSAKFEDRYTYIEYLFDDYFIAYNNNLGVINSNGEKVIDFKFDVINKIGDSNVVQAKDISTDTIELFSKELVSLGKYKNAIATQRENYIEVNYEDSTIYFDFDGKEIANTEIFKNNRLFSVKKDGKWGFKDINGEIKIECIYDEVTEFNEYGFAGIKLGDKWGAINIDNNIVLEPTYELKNISTKPFFIDKYYRVYYGYGSVYYTIEE